MRLNIEDKEELRNEVEKVLLSTPGEERLFMPKEILEELLFDEVTYNSGRKQRVKLPVWSGDFLKKLDLSQIDFTNVSWALLIQDDRDVYATFRMHSDKNFFDKIKHHYNKPNYEGVNYSGTNAKIDLSKSFEALAFGEIMLIDCNFSRVDFTGVDLSKLRLIKNCNLKNAKIKIPAEVFAKTLIVPNCDLQGIDLSDCTLDLYELCSHGGNFEKINFKDTGLKIILDKRYNDLIYPPNEPNTSYMIWKTRLRKSIKYKKFEGCYINGILIKSNEQRQETIEEKKKEYEDYKNSKFGSVISDLKEQQRKIKIKQLTKKND